VRHRVVDVAVHLLDGLRLALDSRLHHFEAVFDRAQRHQRRVWCDRRPPVDRDAAFEGGHR